ncbi:hypothetical protein GCM10010924_13610 [Rhizobium wenxiniae]|uniref:Uncharacterized protein n=1 Tax=Rhizobium wenxiniae TaxID=1737357 RepID=A0A7W9Y3F1_9HYPH|nr:hypothetical protein [Rhizobium wenxiniae]GGF87153.1 hypothetical protein GCM10010924_13610 [Rhizobium wenxiniae]
MHNFQPDDETLEALENLRVFYGIETYTGVIRRALAVATLLKDYSEPDGSLRVLRPNTEDKEVVKVPQRYKE